MNIEDYSKGEYRDSWRVSLRMDSAYLGEDITDEQEESLTFLHTHEMSMEEAYYIVSFINNISVELR